MDFKQAQQAYAVLKRQYDQGNIAAEEFQQRVDGLTVTDVKGDLWQIGVKSGHWYRLVEDNWVEDQPPMDAPTTSLPAAVSLPPRPQHDTLIMQPVRIAPRAAAPVAASAPARAVPVPRKKSPTWLIVLIVVVVLGCCIVAILGVLIFGPAIVNALNSGNVGYVTPAV
jgi:hypothetical protein